MGDREREAEQHGYEAGVAFGRIGEVAVIQPAVDMDLCLDGVQWACGELRKREVEPQMVVVNPTDYHIAEKIVSWINGKDALLTVAITNNLPDGYWLVGNIDHPECFFGSPGA